MMTKKFLTRLMLGGLILVLAACNAAPVEPTVDANVIYTQAAQTVEAQLTLTAAAQPTATATPEPTATPEATATPELPTATPTLDPTALALTPLSGSPTAAVLVPPTQAAAPTQESGPKPGDNATFLYNVPGDGTKFTPREEFLFAVGWKNSGTTTWNSNYGMVYLGGTLIATYTSIKMDKDVKPGEKYEFNMRMYAPEKPGKYITRWKLVNPQGVYMNEFYFQFVVE